MVGQHPMGGLSRQAPGSDEQLAWDLHHLQRRSCPTWPIFRSGNGKQLISIGIAELGLVSVVEERRKIWSLLLPRVPGMGSARRKDTACVSVNKGGKIVKGFVFFREVWK
jgi:hypothetical protein